MKERIVCILAAAGLAGPAAASESLAQRYACAACHQADFRVGGPSWQEIAARFKDRGTAQLAASIRTGSAGNWGTGAMAPQPQVHDADLDKLVQWILAR